MYLLGKRFLLHYTRSLYLTVTQVLYRSSFTAHPLTLPFALSLALLFALQNSDQHHPSAAEGDKATEQFAQEYKNGTPTML